MDANFAEQLRKLPDLLGHHLLLSLTALAIGIAVSLPMAIAVSRMARTRAIVLGVAGVIQTIPSLALLALMYPLLVAVIALLGLTGVSALGFLPAVIALTLYSMLPILRNTIAGLAGVEPATIEAARGVGMTPRQRLLWVELPLAAPVILAGIRTAAVWVIGIATLATPIGQKCLGNYIFTGLDTLNWVAVLFGCVAAAVLALAVDGILALLERAVREQRRRPAMVAVSLLVLLLVGGLGPIVSFGGRTADQRDRHLVVGTKNFTEQYILGQLLAAELRDAEFEVTLTESLGSAVVFDALRTGEIDVYIDYSGTLWLNHLKRDDMPGRQQVLQGVTDWVAAKHNLRCLGPLGFENTYALLVTSDRARSQSLTSIEDLIAGADSLTVGGTTEFLGRPEWTNLRERYGLNFGNETALNPTILYQAVAEGDVDVAVGFSTDGRIAAFDLAVLSDPRGVFPPYDAVILLSERARDNPAVVNALKPLIDRIDAELMQRANMLVDVEGRSPAAAAEALRQWLRGDAVEAE